MGALAKEDDEQLALSLYRLNEIGSLFTQYSQGEIKTKALAFLDEFHGQLDSISPEEAANRFDFFMKVMDKLFPEKEIFQYFFDYHLHVEIAVAPNLNGLSLMLEHFNQKPPYLGKLDSVLLVNRSNLIDQLDLMADQGFTGDKKIMVLRSGSFGGHYSTLFLRKVENEMICIVSDSGGGSAKGWVDSICKKIRASKLFSNRMQLITFAPPRQSDGVSCSIAALRDILESCKLDLFHFVGALPQEKKPYNKEMGVFLVQNYPPSFMKLKQSISYLGKYLEDVPYAQSSPVTKKGRTLAQVVADYTVKSSAGERNSYLSKKGFKYSTFLMKKLLES